MIVYTPKETHNPTMLLDVPTAWSPCESIIKDIITRFRIDPEVALDLGVDWGFSTSALANYFGHVIAVDAFGGEAVDSQTGYRDPDMFYRVAKLLEGYPVTLVQSYVREWMTKSRGHYGITHIDLFHEYQLTYDVAMWAVECSDVVILHDTVSFPEVARAMGDVAAAKGMHCYNWNERFGLGILSWREVL